MFERSISVKDVAQAVQSGVTLEDYSSEMPEPSRLILGFHGKRRFHVVTSEDPEIGRITIVTAYIPEPHKWNRDFKSRRS